MLFRSLGVDIPVGLYKAVREMYPESRPPFRTRAFDVQLIGGMVLAAGRIAEMKTGEGKTIVAPMALPPIPKKTTARGGFANPASQVSPSSAACFICCGNASIQVHIWSYIATSNSSKQSGLDRDDNKR